MTYRAHFTPDGGINGEPAFAVYDPSRPGAIGNPFGNLNHVKLHSQMDYFHVIHQETHNISCPALYSNHFNHNQEYIYSRGTLGTFAGMDNLVAFVQQANGKYPNAVLVDSLADYGTYRTISVGIDANKSVIVQDAFRMNIANFTYPSFSDTIILTVMSTEKVYNSHAWHLNAATGVVAVGYGTFNTENHYTRQDGLGELKIAEGETEFQSSNGGFKYINKLGNVRSTSNYTGSANIESVRATAT